MLSHCVTTGLSDSILEVIIAVIYRHLFSVYSWCHTMC
jgi:hypothetical protein